MSTGHTVRFEQVEVDAYMALAISVEPPIANSAQEAAVTDFIGMEKRDMPTRIRTDRDFFPMLWTSSKDGGYVESNIPRDTARINEALGHIADLLGDGSIFIPVDQ